MKKSLFLGIAVAMLGCGDKATTTPDSSVVTDAMVTDARTDSMTGDAMTGDAGGDSGIIRCEETIGACMAEVSNAAAARNAAPEYRITGLVTTSPANLATVNGRNLVNGFIQRDEVNWLIQAQGASADGEIMVRTGAGARSSTSCSYAFYNNNAIGEGEANRWNPVILPGMLQTNMVSTSGSLTVRIPFLSGASVGAELPLKSVRFYDVTLTEDRTCIGVSAENAGGKVSGFVTVADSEGIMVTAINAPLCTLLAGISCNQPRMMWGANGLNRPDSLCTAEGVCTKNMAGMMDQCDPNTTCNAWQIVGNFSAAGVEIE